jgi:hypothetical protein
VSDEHVFVDDGISGAEFVKRPGFLRLMNALKPRPAFQILVMSEESRLGRESIETSYALIQIIDTGVRLFFYLEDRERTLESAIDKVMLALTNFASEVERERAKQRTYDAHDRGFLWVDHPEHMQPMPFRGENIAVIVSVDLSAGTCRAQGEGRLSLSQEVHTLSLNWSLLSGGFSPLSELFQKDQALIYQNDSVRLLHGG